MVGGAISKAYIPAIEKGVKNMLTKGPLAGFPRQALHAWKVIHDAEGENDSLVSVKSAVWGKHLGTWPADHWHTINKRWCPIG